MNVQQYLRQAKLGHLLDPAHESTLANKGIDMLRIPASINIPSIDEPSDLTHGTAVSCGKWLTHLGFMNIGDKLDILTQALTKCQKPHDVVHVA
eukprot:1374111-Karenia_brevis.AAC.1